jgi:hypothetical protein
MSKRKKRKKKRSHKTNGNSNAKHEQTPYSRGLVNMPGLWEIILGVALLLAGAGLSYFTGNPKILYLGALGVCVLVFYASHRLVLHLESSSKTNTPKVVYFGGLSPGNEPSDPLPPGLPPDTIQLLLGDDLRVLSASQNPLFSKDGKTFLSIAIRDGEMRLTATILDKNNQPICRIINNEFQAFPERAFNPKQPDEHSLIVRDAEGNEVLHVRFLNPKTIWLTGRFQIPGLEGPLLVLRDEGIRWPGGGGIGHLTIDMTESTGGMIGF